MDPVFESVTIRDWLPEAANGPKTSEEESKETAGTAMGVPTRMSCVVLPARLSVAWTAGPAAEGE